MITQDGTILAGYARVGAARQQGLLSLSCIEHELTEVGAHECIGEIGAMPLCRTSRRYRSLRLFITRGVC
jgi:hypothetical protein